MFRKVTELGKTLTRERFQKQICPALLLHVFLSFFPRLSHLEAFPEAAGDAALAAGGDDTVAAAAPTPEAGDGPLRGPAEEGATGVAALT